MAAREEAVITSTDGEYLIRQKNDGEDHWPLVRACIGLGIDQAAWIRALPSRPADIEVTADGVRGMLHPIIFSNPKRMVFRLDAGGRTYILKRARMGTIGLRHLFPRAMGTTYFTRVMAKVNAAVRRGCGATQDYHLVAERWVGAFRQEVWVLLEYVEGSAIRFGGDDAARRAALVACVEELLAYGLTLDDVSLGNFIYAEGPAGARVRAIDISCRPLTRLQAVKMRLKMSARHGLALQPKTATDKALTALLKLRYGIRKALTGRKI